MRKRSNNMMNENDCKNRIYKKPYTEDRTKKWCSGCEGYLLVDKFGNAYNGGLKSQCKKCGQRKADTIRQYNKKILVNRLGGKCIHCGYDKCIAALDFHHIDPEEKKMDFAHIMHHKSIAQETIDELEKCLLLCSNCHREEHARIKRDDLYFIELLD